MKGRNSRCSPKGEKTADRAPEGTAPRTGQGQVGASGAIYVDRQVGIARFCRLPGDWIVGAASGLVPVPGVMRANAH